MGRPLILFWYIGQTFYFLSSILKTEWQLHFISKFILDNNLNYFYTDMTRGGIEWFRMTIMLWIEIYIIYSVSHLIKSNKILIV